MSEPLTEQEIRDYYAGQALAGKCARNEAPPRAALAQECFDIADAMMKERAARSDSETPSTPDNYGG